MKRHILLSAFVVAVAAVAARADAPAATYIFPAGGQRGTSVNVKVGGLFLYDRCGFEMLGKGIVFPNHLTRTETLWFEGPILTLTDSQRAEDYPKDMLGTLQLAKDALLGNRNWRLWTSQGATPSMKFVVGELPEIIEQEIDGEPVPTAVTLPVTINGRIFPRNDVDVWTFTAKKGQSVWCEVQSARLGLPLDARLEIRDANGRRLAENDDAQHADPRLRFVAPADGQYHVHIHDIQYNGGQAYVYRLTLTSGPMIQRVYPLGGKRGSKIDLTLDGQALPSANVSVSIPANAPAELPYRFESSNTVLLDIGAATEYLGAAPAQPVALPATFNGRIAAPGKIDAWKFLGKKGETWEFDLRAGRLGSPLDGVLTLHDAAGKQVARAETSGAQVDPVLAFTVPADGAYSIQVQDRFRSRGGPEFAYRLHAKKAAAPDFKLNLVADAVTVPRKKDGKLKLNVERIGGFKEPIVITAEGLPAGVTLNPATLAAGQNQIELTFKADEKAKIAQTRVRIVGTAKVNGPKVKGKDVKQTATLLATQGESSVDNVLVAVALPTPFVIKGVYDMGFAARGSAHQRTYKIERNGYTGPLEVRLTDRQARHLQGVTGPVLVIPADKNEFTYTASLPPWMETGRTSRTCVMGIGTIKEPDGTEHRVSFTSINQNEQLVAVVGPGQLALDLERTSCGAVPGETALVPIRVQRGLGLTGDVKLELIAPTHIRGVSAESVVLNPKQDRGQLTLRFAPKFDSPFNMPLIIRATLMNKGTPIIAEQKIDVR